MDINNVSGQDEHFGSDLSCQFIIIEPHCLINREIEIKICYDAHGMDNQRFLIMIPLEIFMELGVVDILG